MVTRTCLKENHITIPESEVNLQRHIFSETSSCVDDERARLDIQHDIVSIKNETTYYSVYR